MIHFYKRHWLMLKILLCDCWWRFFPKASINVDKTFRSTFHFSPQCNALKEWFMFFVFCVLYSKNKLISNCKKFMIRDQKDLLNRVHSFLSSATSIQITLLTLYGFNNYHKTSYSLNISYLNIKIGKEIQWKTKLLVQCSNFHLIERIQVNLQLLFKYKII